MNLFAWFQRITGVAAALVIAAAAGYRVRDWQGLSLTKLDVGEIAPADSFVQTLSFSEVENARAELSGLAWRFRTEARVRHLAALPKTGTAESQEVARHAIMRDLERGIEEFKNTPDELLFVQDLLLQLRADGRLDRWLDVYFEILYRRPTEELVASHFVMARRLAHETGRESELDACVQHLRRIPLDFPAKRVLSELEAQATAIHQARPNGSESWM